MPSKQTTGALADRMHDVGSAVLTPPLAAMQYVPGINMLKSSSEDQAARLRNQAVQRAQRMQDLAPPNASITTNR
jgi:hypothetical protein